MKKHLSILVAFILISVIFLSGCTKEGLFSAFEEAKPTFEEFSVDKTTGDNPLTVRFSALGRPREGDDIFYSWSFGDGQTSNKQNPTHTYQKPGMYIATLIIKDINDVKNQKSVQIIVTPSNSLPVITASATPTSGRAPVTVSFTSSATDSDGIIQSYHWDFDDGSTSSQQNPTHTFEDIKYHYVKLTVTDNAGGTSQKTITIYSLGNSKPVASATADPNSGTIPLTVKFTSNARDSDGTIESYHWDFDDGYTSSQPNPTHTFNSAGTYYVSLTVEDNEGATHTYSMSPIKASEIADPGDEDPFDDPYDDPTPPDTTSYTFSPTDDAYVDSEHPDKTYGTKDKNFITVKSYPSAWIDDHYAYGYLKFDLRSLPSDAVVYSAKLRLYTYLGSPNILYDPDIRVHTVNDNSWDEATITYNNQPYLHNSYIDSVSIDTDNDYLEWDLTYHVKYHPGEIVSYRVSAYESGTGHFFSDEVMGLLADDYEKPILELQVVE